MADSFLRRFKKSQWRDGHVASEAFECAADDQGLSMHIRTGELETDAGVREYQQRAAYPSGDLLGVCELGSKCFAGMPLPVPAAPDGADPWPDQHYELTPCPDPAQRRRLARFAVKLLDYVKSR